MSALQTGAANSQNPSRHRLVLGSSIFVLSFVPWLAIPIAPFLGFGVEITATVVLGLLVLGELIAVLALLILGREAFSSIRHWLRDWFMAR